VSPEDFARKAGLTFRDPGLLWRALTHRSYVNEHSDALEDNERLEFLGDAVLSLVIAEALLARYPELNEGDLSQARAALCSAESLAERGRELEIGAYLRLGRGEEKQGGREKAGLLADAFEAAVGAVFLDAGLPAARAAVLARFGAVLEDHASAPSRDPKSVLQELLQGRTGVAPRYEPTGEEGPAHQKTHRMSVWHEDRLLAEGEGTSKRSAAQAAARLALRFLDGGVPLDDPVDGVPPRSAGSGSGPGTASGQAAGGGGP